MTPHPAELQVIEYGPTRGIGVAMVVNGGGDFAGLWQKQLFPRAGEITRPPKAAAFGVCRCIPGIADGSFEYVALLEATADAAVPNGMVAVDITKSHYAVFQAPSLMALGDTWRRASEALAGQAVWVPCCGAGGCQCASRPSFEYHAWDSRETGKVSIYMAVRRG